MYLIGKTTHDQDGKPLELIEIIETDNTSDELSPFVILRKASLQQKQMGGKAKYLLVIDGCLLNSNQAERWARDEYEDLPKCSWCSNILRELLVVHSLSGSSSFCSIECKDRDHLEALERLDDEHECDYC